LARGNKFADISALRSPTSPLSDIDPRKSFPLDAHYTRTQHWRFDDDDDDDALHEMVGSSDIKTAFRHVWRARSARTSFAAVNPHALDCRGSGQDDQP
jgi:hypothetical protein